MHDVIQHSVDAESYAQFFFVGLDVDIRSAATQSIDQQDIDKPDNRGISGHSRKRRQVNLFIVLNDLNILDTLRMLKVNTVKRNQIGIGDAAVCAKGGEGFKNRLLYHD